MDGDKLRVNLLIKGIVQGVNYRHTVQRYAQEYNITGTIENKEDGTVAIQAEGFKNDIKRFIKRIEIKPCYSLDEIEEKKKRGEIIKPQPLINVKEIVGKDNFQTATGQFDEKGFKINYGEKDNELLAGISSDSYQIGALSDITGYDFYILGKKYDNISLQALRLNTNFKYLLAVLLFGFCIILSVFVYFFLRF